MLTQTQVKTLKYDKQYKNIQETFATLSEAERKAFRSSLLSYMSSIATNMIPLLFYTVLKIHQLDEGVIYKDEILGYADKLQEKIDSKENFENILGLDMLIEDKLVDLIVDIRLWLDQDKKEHSKVVVEEINEFNRLQDFIRGVFEEEVGILATYTERIKDVLNHY